MDVPHFYMTDQMKEVCLRDLLHEDIKWGICLVRKGSNLPNSNSQSLYDWDF